MSTAVSKPKHTLLLFLLTVAGTGVPFGIAVWIVGTHDLHYNVYSDGDEVWYREYFPTYFNLIVTAILSLFFGLSVATIVCIRKYYKGRIE